MQAIFESPLEVLRIVIQDPLVLLFFVSVILLFAGVADKRAGSVLMAFVGGYLHVWIIFLSGIYAAYQFSTI